MVWGRDNIIQIQERTLAVPEVAGQAPGIRLDRGAVAAVLNRLDQITRRGTFRVRTPAAVASVRRAAFFVKVEDSANSYVCAWHGERGVARELGGTVDPASSRHVARRITRRRPATPPRARRRAPDTETDSRPARAGARPRVEPTPGRDYTLGHADTGTGTQSVKDRSIAHAASEDFARARARESLTRILSTLSSQSDDLLSLQEVKSILKPTSESYLGMKAVPIAKIVGSEGRYRDFNRWFLPRHRHLKSRWTRVDMAHLESVTLPPVKLYEIGGVYFVRDGNHRVSVARSQGVEFIDAEVVGLDTEIRLHPGMTRRELREAVIAYERERFYETTGLKRLRPDAEITFTVTGRYDDLLAHINCHKYYLNLDKPQEIPYQEALLSWYDTVYRPIVDIIRERRMLAAFPGRTEADLYVWISRRWDELKRRYDPNYPIIAAAEDFRRRFGKTLLRRLWGRAVLLAGSAWSELRTLATGRSASRP